MTQRELGVEDVRFLADLSRWEIESSADLSASPDIIGQDAAMDAMRLGLGLRRPGYNVFVVGLKGAGRFAATRLLLEKLDLEARPRRAMAYVHNFERPEQPLLVSLPEGEGRAFRDAIDRLREFLRDEVPTVLGSELLVKNRQRLIAKYERESKRIFGEFEGRAEEEGFRVVQAEGPNGSLRMTDLFPVIGEDAVPMEQFLAHSEEEGLGATEIAEVTTRYRRFKDELEGLAARHRRMRVRYHRLVEDSERRSVEEALGPPTAEIRTRFGVHDDRVSEYLDGLQQELVDNLFLFRDDESVDANGQGPTSEGFLWLIRVNLLREPVEVTEETPFARVIEESHPSYRNLLGTVELGGDPQATTFMDIRGGSLLEADGGYLLLNAVDVLSESRVWSALKRVLRTRELDISPRDDGPGAQVGLKPTPIPVDLKVVMVGGPDTYGLLHAADPEFRKIFKVKAEFDDSMLRSDEATRAFLSVLKRIIDHDRLLEFDRGALEILLEEGVRMTGVKNRLSTQISDLADIMREATWFAERRGALVVAREDAITARDQRRRRHGLIERRMLDIIREGKMMIEVDGLRVGQANGLAYYELEDAEFGMPLRISATSGTGKAGVVNIERESDLSGSIHDKGFLILSGFLSAQFAQDKPLALSARIAFEQSYGVIDGDSASLAELCALLSSLSSHPLRQDLAVTGSLNQRGDVQPVGGVPEKITGFFHACRLKGFTGSQGVIIPESNVDDVHLPSEVSEAIAAGRFHIYAVGSFRDALELLSSRPADETLAACDERLARFAETVRDFS